jgi:predicted ABC-type transport system involved in lysophospholipase L1 biosynthesis ATPase subunit
VRESGATAIVASHDGRLAALSDRTLELRDGRLSRGA